MSEALQSPMVYATLPSNSSCQPLVPVAENPAGHMHTGMSGSSPASFAKEEEELPGSYLGIRGDGHAGLQPLQAWQLRNQGSNIALQLAV